MGWSSLPFHISGQSKRDNNPYTHSVPLYVQMLKQIQMADFSQFLGELVILHFSRLTFTPLIRMTTSSSDVYFPHCQTLLHILLLWEGTLIVGLILTLIVPLKRNSHSKSARVIQSCMEELAVSDPWRFFNLLKHCLSFPMFIKHLHALIIL